MKETNSTKIENAGTPVPLEQRVINHRTPFKCTETTYARCGKCNQFLYFMLPEHIYLPDLNSESFASRVNMFYLCFHCRDVIQVGVGHISSGKVIPCAAKSSLSAEERVGTK